jgi:3-hydroxyanthranilate 3,4-dioxygenase
MALERKKTLNVFREAAAAWGSHDEFPVGPKGTDPMPHLSRSRVAQPFFVISAADQVLVHMAGRARLELRESDVTVMALVPGDTVYVPAGVPSRLVPDGEVLDIRLKAEPPAAEAVAWYCPCGARISAREVAGPGAPIDPLQESWWRAAQEFNSDPQLRTCPACGAVHPPVELGDIAWPDVAAAIRTDG